MRRHSIACVIDADVIGEVRQGQACNRNAEYDISVVRGLRRLGHAVTLIPAVERTLQTLDDLARLAPGVVFNLAFSATPLEAPFAGALELLGLPYTGSGPLAIALANDKIRSRRLLADAGVPVPRFVELADVADPAAIDFHPPFIVKPVCLGNSEGIHGGSVVDSAAAAVQLGRRIRERLHAPAVCDQFILGRELQVGLIESAPRRFDVTGTIELHFAGAPPGRGFKSEVKTVGTKRWRFYEVSLRMARLGERTLAEIAELSRRVAAVLDLRGYAKVDLRLDDRDRAVIIEANANPGLWSKLAMWRTPTFDRTLEGIVRAALRRAQE